MVGGRLVVKLVAGLLGKLVVELIAGLIVRLVVCSVETIVPCISCIVLWHIVEMSVVARSSFMV